MTSCCGGPPPAETSTKEDFKIGEVVEVRDSKKDDWRTGTVVSVEPLKVQQKQRDESYEWEEVRRPPVDEVRLDTHCLAVCWANALPEY